MGDFLRLKKHYEVRPTLALAVGLALNDATARRPMPEVLGAEMFPHQVGSKHAPGTLFVLLRVKDYEEDDSGSLMLLRYTVKVEETHDPQGPETWPYRYGDVDDVSDIAKEDDVSWIVPLEKVTFHDMMRV